MILSVLVAGGRVDVTAGIGSRYVDLAATNGAIEWVKAAGSGNTGWRVVYGDTGWCTVRSWNAAGVVTGDPFPAGWKPRTGVPGYVAVRRSGHRVSVALSFIEAAVTGTADLIYVLPAGFDPDPKIRDTTLISITLSGNKAFAITPRLYRASMGLLAGEYIQGALLDFETASAWPSTLP